MDMWFTADSHFFHRNVAVTHRGFPSPAAMNDALVERWNDTVRPGDIVYHLGDVSFGKPNETADVLARLSGEIHLIVGNHDKRVARWSGALASVESYREIKVAGQRIVLFHYPIASWHQIHRGSWHLHGHTHGTLPEDPTIARMDVGVDTHPELRPWHLDEVAARLATRTGTAGDHHQRSDHA